MTTNLVLLPDLANALSRLRIIAVQQHEKQRRNKLMSGNEIRIARSSSNLTLSQLSRKIWETAKIRLSETAMSKLERGAPAAPKMRRWLIAATDYFKELGWEFDGTGAFIFVPRKSN